MVSIGEYEFIRIDLDEDQAYILRRYICTEEHIRKRCNSYTELLDRLSTPANAFYTFRRMDAHE